MESNLDSGEENQKILVVEYAPQSAAENEPRSAFESSDTGQNYNPLSSLTKYENIQTQSVTARDPIHVTPNSQFDEPLQELRESLSNLRVFMARSEALVNRISIVVTHCIPLIDFRNDDHRIKTNLALLLVLLEETTEYFLVFGDYSRDMIEHLAKFGFDEEVYSKWNQRLQFIVIGLDLAIDVTVMFDRQVDQQNLKADLAHLRRELESITDNPQFILAIKKGISKQESLAYKSVTSPKSSLSMDPKQIKYLDILGSGSFGIVWKARIGSDFVAVKKMKMENLSANAVDGLRAEAEIMRQLSHPRIVACIGVVESPLEYCMVLEFCPSGSLASLIADAPPISYFHRLDLAADIAEGMAYLHRVNVVHRDLKPGNVVLDVYMRAKIADFGLAVVKSASMTSFRGDGEAGTPAFMAPECFGIVPLYSTKSDVYAFGIMLWELGHWKPSYLGVDKGEIRDAIKAGERLPISKEVPDDLKQLVTKSWDQNPRDRMTFRDLLKELKFVSGKKSDDEVVAMGELRAPFYVLRQAELPTSNASSNNPSTSVATNNITNLALIKFWDNSTENVGEITWEILNDAIFSFLGLTDAAEFNYERARKQFDYRMNLDKPTLKRLYLVIQEVDPKIFFQAFINSSNAANYSINSNAVSIINTGSSVPTRLGTRIAKSPQKKIEVWNHPLSEEFVTHRNEQTEIIQSQVSSIPMSRKKTLEQQLLRNKLINNDAILEISPESRQESAAAVSKPPDRAQKYVTIGRYRIHKRNLWITIVVLLMVFVGISVAIATVLLTSVGKNIDATPILNSTIPSPITSFSSLPIVLQSSTTLNSNYVASNPSTSGPLTTLQARSATTLPNLTSNDTSTNVPTFSSTKTVVTTSYATISQLSSTSTADLTTKATSSSAVTVVSTNIATTTSAYTTISQLYLTTTSSLTTSQPLSTVPPQQLWKAATLAGSGIGKFADGQSTNASFYYPAGLAIDSRGFVFIADSWNQRIRMINSSGYVSTYAGSQGAGVNNGQGTSAQFKYPYSIYSDVNDTKYVGDEQNHLVRMITPSGYVSTLEGGGSGSPGFANGQNVSAVFNHPLGVATDSKGNVFVCDSRNNMIRKINTTGFVSVLAGNLIAGEIDGQGSAASFSNPIDLVVDSKDSIFVADGSGTIRKIDQFGNVTTIAGSLQGYIDGYGATARFAEPRGIALGPDDSLFVSDCRNYCIRLISSSGWVQTIAGDQASAGYADGTGTAANFRCPAELKYFNNTLYVTDKDDHRIRTLTRLS